MTKRSLLDVDWTLVLPVFVLVLLSLTTLFSISFSLFRSQFIFLIISLFAFLFFSQVNYRIIKLYSAPIYITSLVLLALVLVLGAATRGSVRWIEIWGIKIQFSEILKPFLLVSFASFLSSRENYSFKTLLTTIIFLAPISLLIFIQPDLGNTLIYLSVAVLTLIAFGIPFRFFLALTVPLGLLSPLIWRLLHDYQKQRIATFLNPQDPLGSSYNAIQSVIAVGSGMFFGKGLGQGTQSALRFLPERHTDFIFATLSEELGFVGSLIVILCFAFLLFRIFKIFSNSQETFPKVFAISAFSIILLQAFVNVGMNIGILPIVGITLPFVSYGGSSLLSSFILLGLVSSISRKSDEDNVLEIK